MLKIIENDRVIVEYENPYYNTYNTSQNIFKLGR